MGDPWSLWAPPANWPNLLSLRIRCLPQQGGNRASLDVPFVVPFLADVGLEMSNYVFPKRSSVERGSDPDWTLFLQYLAVALALILPLQYHKAASFWAVLYEPSSRPPKSSPRSSNA